MNSKRFFLLPLVMLAATSAAQAPQITFESQELAPGIHMLWGKGGFAGGNLGLLTGEGGVVLIDDGLQPLSETTLAAVGRLSGQPVDFVVNTHVHGDHLGGNQAFHEAGATIIGHDNVRQRLAGQGWPQRDDPTPPPESALPQVTFDKSMTFHLNGHEAFVFHVAAAHTDGDSVIFFRSGNVIHAGDVFFNGLFPFIDLDSGGSVDGYLAAQEDILSLAGPDTKIIPGHGPAAGKADLQAARDMLADARDRVRKLVAAGRSIEQILEENPLESYHEQWSWEFITTERMTRTLHRSLTQGQQ